MQRVPIQQMITIAKIEEMITWRPRRMRLNSEWPTPLHEPTSMGKDWALVLPFSETLGNAFNAMCDVDSIGLRESKGRCWTYLNNSNRDDTIVSKVRKWLEIIGEYVAIRDCLALSFALDYDRKNGDPSKLQTKIGSLRIKAKPYDSNMKPDMKAADALIEECMQFLQNMSCYERADVVVAMPPSDPSRPFKLSEYLAVGIAKLWKKPNLTSFIQTIHPRQSLKHKELKQKLPTLKGTIKFRNDCFKGKTVLIVDDLYQSGVSINYLASMLMKVGAKCVFGLACDKTCTNDDNIGE